MKAKPDNAIAEVRAARTALCARFRNDPRKLLAHFRAEQRDYRGKVIKNWSEIRPVEVLREVPTTGKRRQK